MMNGGGSTPAQAASDLLLGAAFSVVAKGIAKLEVARATAAAAKEKLSAGVARAAAARDAKLAEVRSGSGKQRNKVTTVVGAYDFASDKVAVGAKVDGCDKGKCAEDLAAEALGSPPPKTIKFTDVIRPRTDEVIPPCDRCKATYGTQE